MCNREFQLFPSSLLQENRTVDRKGRHRERSSGLTPILSRIRLVSISTLKRCLPEYEYFTSSPDIGSPWAVVLSVGKTNSSASHVLPPSSSGRCVWSPRRLCAMDDLAGLAIQRQPPTSLYSLWVFKTPWIFFNLEIRKHLGSFFMDFEGYLIYTLLLSPPHPGRQPSGLCSLWDRILDVQFLLVQAGNGRGGRAIYCKSVASALSLCPQNVPGGILASAGLWFTWDIASVDKSRKLPSFSANRKQNSVDLRHQRKLQRKMLSSGPCFQELMLKDHFPASASGGKFKVHRRFGSWSAELSQEIFHI